MEQKSFELTGNESGVIQEKSCCCEPKTTEERLNRCLHQCGHYLHHYTAGPRQTMVIQLLQQHGPMSQKDIQETLQIQAGSVSELISKLERKGFLVRKQDEQDKRKVLISLTQTGLEFETKPYEQMLHERYGVLSEEEQQQLTGLLETLLSSWDRKGHCR